MNIVGRLVKNFVVLMWWLGLTYIAVDFPSVIMTLSAGLLAAGPILYWGMKEPKKPKVTVLPRKFAMFATITSMSVLTLGKAALTTGVGSHKHGGMADRS